jgi:hypothetical protein
MQAGAKQRGVNSFFLSTEVPRLPLSCCQETQDERCSRRYTGRQCPLAGHAGPDALGGTIHEQFTDDDLLINSIRTLKLPITQIPTLR